MKFTQNEATNQRIERISMKHAVVGIDIAKDKHVAQIADFRGRVLTPYHLSFDNTLDGFQKLMSWVKKTQQKFGLHSCIFGLEPTGHYWFNFANWLHEQNHDVVLVNPVTTHRNKENRDNSPSKNDPKDAIIIADLVSRGYYTEYAPQEKVFEQLKTVMSDREFWSKQRGSIKNRIIRWIDINFPEFHRVFKNWEVPRALATLRAFPLPSDLRKMRIDDVIEGWREHGMNRAGGARGRSKAAQLIATAERSISHKKNNASRDATRQELERLLNEYDRLCSFLQEIEENIITLLGEIPVAQQLQSIPGLGTIAIAAILGFGGDPSNYAHGRQLLRRAGLNLAECTSGKYKGQIKLSKRGSSGLRKHLYLATVGLLKENPDFKQWHEKNQSKGMTKMASLFKLIGKLARIVIGMVQRGEMYRAQQQVLEAA